MQISIRLFGNLRQYLPKSSRSNTYMLAINDNTPLIDVLSQLAIPAEQPYLVLFNDTKLDKQLYAETIVSATDNIILLPPIKGG